MLKVPYFCKSYWQRKTDIFVGHPVYIGRIDIDNLKVCIIFMFIFTCIQCNFIYILKLEVLLIVFLA